MTDWNVITTTIVTGAVLLTLNIIIVIRDVVKLTARVKALEKINAEKRVYDSTTAD